MSHDLVIRKGNIADGRGSPLYRADIAVNDGVISRIGSISERGREEILHGDLSHENLPF